MLLTTCILLAICTQTSFGIWNNRWDANYNNGRGGIDYKTSNGHTFGAHGTLNNGLGLGVQGTLNGNSWSAGGHATHNLNTGGTNIGAHGTLSGNKWSAGGHATHNLNTGRTNFGAHGSIDFGKNWSGSANINHSTHGGGTSGGFSISKKFRKRSLACLLRCDRACRGSTKTCFKECLTLC